MASAILFANDLRTKDHEPLNEALMHDDKIYGLFIFYKPALARYGAKRNALLLDCMNELNKNLGALGISFSCLESEHKDDAKKLLSDYIKNHKIDKVFFNEPIEPEYAQLFSALKPSAGMNIRHFQDQMLFKPSSFLNKSGEPYQIYTPFYKKACEELHIKPPFTADAPKPHRPLVNNKVIHAPSWLLTEPYDRTLFSSTEKGVHRHLEYFLEHKIKNYANQRDYFAVQGTSMISPYLAQGSLSIQQVMHTLFEAYPSALNPNHVAHTFLKELLWREFFRYLWASFPALRTGKPYKSWGENIQWNYDQEALNKWKKGETGFPLIDAAMRNFARTGLMHNRLRMIVASFLTKNLLIDWREGEHYFLKNLLDADLPNNNGGWQWSSSVGADAQPYFRIFNPESQSQRYDQEGIFIKSEIPALKNLDTKSLHAPYKKYTDADLQNMGYCAPIVDLSLTRTLAIKLYKEAQSKIF